MLLLVLACGVTWYVATHPPSGTGGPAAAGPDPVVPAAAGPTEPATLEGVERLRAHADGLYSEAWGFLTALNARESKESWEHEHAGASGPRLDWKPQPWQVDLRDILLRMGVIGGPPAMLDLKLAEDALMRGDAAAAGRALHQATQRVRTAEGYMERVRKVAADNGLQT